MFSHSCETCIKCASHSYCTQRGEWWQTVENAGAQLVSRGPAVYLHLPQYLQHMSGSLNMAQYPGACWPGVRGWRMRWNLHVSVCSLMTERSLFPLFFSSSNSLFSLSFILSISDTTHLPQVTYCPSSYSHKHLHVGFLCDISKWDNWNVTVYIYKVI